MKKKRDKKKGKYLGPILFIIISALLGFLFGYLSGGILEGFFVKYVNAETWYMGLFNKLILLFIFIIGFLFHIIIHEAGHLIFGLISRYEFVSFRVGSFTLIQEDGKFRLRRFNIPGTAGQCLMMPPEKKDGDYPFILYNSGGVLANIVVSLIIIFIATNIKELSYIKVILILFSIGGIFAAITNGIPLKIGGISNDAHNIMTMIRDKDSKDSFHLQLKVNGLLSKGIRIKDMPLEEFKLKEDIDYKNPLNYSRIFLNHNYYLDNMDFEGARGALEFGSRYVDGTIAIYQMEMAVEQLFLELIGNCDNGKIEGLYDKNLKKYIKASKFMIGKKRIMMAYELFYKNDREKALKYFGQLKVLAKKYPVKGEVDMELMLGEYLNTYL